MREALKTAVSLAVLGLCIVGLLLAWHAEGYQRYQMIMIVAILALQR